jgi:hypothetical protein
MLSSLSSQEEGEEKTMAVAVASPKIETIDHVIC